MKKVLLSLAFVLATSSLLNASTSKDLVLPTNQVSIKINEDFSCLLDAYNLANYFESISPGGAYSWSIERWTGSFKLAFEACNLGLDISVPD